jgi:hypothetical protein
MMLSRLRVLESCLYRQSTMIRTTRHETLCSRATHLLSLSELDIKLWLTRSGPPFRNSIMEMIM